MAAIEDLVLTFCPKMRYVPQRILKLLKPVLEQNPDYSARFPVVIQRSRPVALSDYY